MGRPADLTSLNPRAQLAVALRLAGWSGQSVGRILGVSAQYSSGVLRYVGVPYWMTTDRKIRESKGRR